MKASEGTLGRIFVLRLEDGDIIPDCIEEFAAANNITTGHVSLIGGINSGEIVSGPHDPNQRPLEPIKVKVNEAHEVSAVGVLAPDANGKPILHMHGSLSRKQGSLGGCFRPGIRTWLVGEAIISELIGVEAVRVEDPAAGMELLQVGPAPATAPSSAVPATPAAPAPATTEPRTHVLHLFNAEIN